MSAVNAASIVLLVHLLVNGAHAKAATLASGCRAHVGGERLLFGLWFWQLDGGGPMACPRCEPSQRDFLFLQQTEPALLDARLEADVLDYLYVSLTNATASSPTDAMPLSHWAKMLMLV